PGTGRHKAAHAGHWWRWGPAGWTIVLSAVFALVVLVILVLLAVFRGRAGCAGQAGRSAGPSESPSGSSTASPPEAGTSDGAGDGAGDSAACSCDYMSCSSPGEACDRFVNDTCDSLFSGCGGSDSDGGSGCGTGCDSGAADCSGGDGCSGSGASPDCSGFAAGHGVSGSLLVAVPVVLATPGVGARIGIAAVRGYQRWLSPRLAVRCRHTPTCSQYGLTAIERYGLLAGARLALARIRRCTDRVPPGSYDPVPW
ncbi:MAG: membrane protein insertion efficiency factor YidD, partial [Micromonosporaceae bacterium]